MSDFRNRQGVGGQVGNNIASSVKCLGMPCNKHGLGGQSGHVTERVRFPAPELWAFVQDM